MLFKEDRFNSEKYDFEYTPNIYAEKYSFRDVCNELNVFTQNVFESLSKNNELFTTIKNKEGRPYRVNVENILNDSDPVFNRTADDIYRVIVSKKDFRKNLEKVGFKEPKDKKSLNFANYLQAVYLFYIMIYFIFPKIKFYDLYDKNRLSSENTLESNTGNEIYEQFIKDAIYQNKKVKSREMRREKAYNDAINEYNDAFFGLFEIGYYRYINMPEQGSKEVFENSLSNKTINSYIKKFEKLYKENIQTKIENKQSNDIFDQYFDYINEIQTKSVVYDFEQGAKALKPYIDELISKKIEIRIPDKFVKIKVYEDNLFDVLNDDEEFIRTIMNTSKLTNTIKNKYYNYDFVDAIDGVWDFEKKQIENYNDSGFLFLKKNKKYYMSKHDLAIICITLKNLDLNVNYISKRTYLDNRSDGQKKNSHSIKRSYRVTKQGSFDASVSSLRDGIFRILCRMVQIGTYNGNYDEFIFYEYPMNLLNNKYMLQIENIKSLEKKTEHYKKVAGILNIL